jgi:chromosome segregation protein
MRRKVSGFEQLFTECKAHLRNAESSKAAVLGRLQQTEKDIVSVHDALATAQQEADQLHARLKNNATEWDDLDADYHRLLNAFSESSTAHQEAHLAYVQQCNVVENIEHEIAFRNQQQEELNNQIIHDTAQCDTELQSIGEIGKEIDVLSDALIDVYATRKTREADLSTSEQQYFQARNVIHELEEKIRSTNKEFQNSQYLINELKEEHNEIKLKLAGVSERLQIEFQTTLEAIQNLEVAQETELEELEMKVERMRKRIENFGEINPMALEAYEEMKSRYDAIHSQRQDILDAKQTLLDTIKEIDDTATERFTDAFDKIREYFIDVFRHLFTEDDSCDLILIDPSRPLESEIEIIAKPKGKRPKSLSQLSGGEKTLTAIALLFSLYLLKPAPFCVFDEVDAPLDDANIQKFNKIVQNFSRDSQFVIVTHNKQTMAAVDVIYGVYMEEQGVSKLSPVDLRQFQHEEILEELEA